jgi:hypothetical protein
MENHGDRDVPQLPPSQSGASSAHLMYLGALLVLIIALLAILWARERRFRVAAEQEVANLRHHKQRLLQENHTLRKAMAAMGAFQAPATRPAEP